MLTVPVMTERHRLRRTIDGDWRVSLMKRRSERSPGQYAEERHTRGLRRYRRRMRAPVLIICVPAIVVTTTLALVLDRNPWWWFAGTVTGAMVTLAVLALNDPPEHIAKWGRGAAGERRTAKALRPLRRRGWKITHDVQRDRGNLDHVLVGPPGVFLLETKVRAGTVSVENGVLTIRYPDDPDEVVTLARLGPQMRGRASYVRAMHRLDDGVRRWVTPVVVLWADFPDRLLEHDGIIYIHGDELMRWLRSLPSGNWLGPKHLRAR